MQGEERRQGNVTPAPARESLGSFSAGYLASTGCCSLCPILDCSLKWFNEEVKVPFKVIRGH